ncbi:uncharacterized protein CLUP02_00287 [Colletotrichum lupini]|uniref:Uncharacterized protein n=1 Tax=Colletotrichum lupini TaxID=145971 RepID=A0A9Q8W8M5_9PEZI|nr:uncharacterized protein CLUP02_00287 [Colletotrichum lupini]UQC73642.1 hypothetical protein CLUP02_00287 [Colletotrichum lupini]
MPWNGPSPVTSTVWLRPNLEPRQRQRQPWTCRRPSPVTSLPIPSQPTRCCLQMLSPYSVTVVVSDRAGTTFGTSTPPYHHCLSPVSQCAPDSDGADSRLGGETAFLPFLAPSGSTNTPISKQPSQTSQQKHLTEFR